MQSYQLTVLDIDLSFRTDADAQRIEAARAFVEEQYGRLKARGGPVGRERVLAMLVLGIADDLLQARQEQKDSEERLSDLLKQIDENIS
ncbi:MAG: cell division protein ZapA [Desulfovibrionaceae bacterium]|nr:cell division protein ZapA [Desulfovibrionaceae bacterium]